MPVLEVLEYPHPFLKEKAKPVEKVDAELQTFLDDMLETMYNDHGGGLAATQVGVDKRIFVMDGSEDHSDPLVFINPEIVESSGSIVELEGCLSFPGVSAKVERANKVTMKALDREGKPFEVTYEGDYCVRCVQHELDHLNGIVFFDHLSPMKRKMLEKKLAKYKKVRL